VNNYLLQVSGVLQFLGIWYIRLGRRLAISTAFLIGCAMCAVVPIFTSYGKHRTFICTFTDI